MTERKRYNEDTVAVWKLPLADGVHEIEFEHGTATGRRVVRLDGNVSIVLYHIRMLRTRLSQQKKKSHQAEVGLRVGAGGRSYSSFFPVHRTYSYPFILLYFLDSYICFEIQIVQLYTYRVRPYIFFQIQLLAGTKGILFCHRENSILISFKCSIIKSVTFLMT